jgi:hypothetical protein
MILGDRRQEKKKKQTHQLNWNVNTGYCSTILTIRLDWDTTHDDDKEDHVICLVVYHIISLYE